MLNESFDDEIAQVQLNIETDYQKKLNEVNDQAMKKLQYLKKEHEDKMYLTYQEYQRRSEIKKSTGSMGGSAYSGNKYQSDD